MNNNKYNTLTGLLVVLNKRTDAKMPCTESYTKYPRDLTAFIQHSIQLLLRPKNRQRQKRIYSGQKEYEVTQFEFLEE